MARPVDVQAPIDFALTDLPVYEQTSMTKYEMVIEHLTQST